MPLNDGPERSHGPDGLARVRPRWIRAGCATVTSVTSVTQRRERSMVGACGTATAVRSSDTPTLLAAHTGSSWTFYGTHSSHVTRTAASCAHLARNRPLATCRSGCMDRHGRRPSQALVTWCGAMSWSDSRATTTVRDADTMPVLSPTASGVGSRPTRSRSMAWRSRAKIFEITETLRILLRGCSRDVVGL